MSERAESERGHVLQALKRIGKLKDGAAAAAAADAQSRRRSLACGNNTAAAIYEGEFRIRAHRERIGEE